MDDPRMAMRAFLTPEQRTLYTTNAWFRAGVDQMGMMIPVFIRGLEVDAEEKDQAMQRDIAAITKGIS